MGFGFSGDSISENLKKLKNKVQIPEREEQFYKMGAINQQLWTLNIL